MKNSIFMKTVLVILLNFSFSLLNFAQVPEMFKYQAVLRDSDGNIVLGSHDITVRIYDAIEASVPVWMETHSGVQTTEQGIINLNIGSQTGMLSSINWNSGSYFLGISIDADPEMGRSQLLSVPYALNSLNAENLSGEISESQISDLQNYLIEETDGSVTNEIQTLSVNENDLSISGTGGNTVTLPVADGSETKLSEGTNISIFGSGTSANPYIISGLTHYIGELFGGGIVFWVSPDGEHGLVMSLDDVSSSAIWSNITSSAGNANDMYDGLANSIAIVNQGGHTTSAAQLCLDYSNDGFDDWYLPALWQISQIYHNAYTLNYVLTNDENPSTIPLVSDQTWTTPLPAYWSSTEYNNSDAWFYYFQHGYQFYNNKAAATFRVRAVRSF